jgi:DNA-binding MurR/RpiR family transcriptional regulator
LEEDRQIIVRMKNHKGRYSPGQRKIAEFVIGNIHTAAFLTGKKLAEASGVSEATVNRLVCMLGYSGYSAFQKDVQQQIMAVFKGDRRFKKSLPKAGSVNTPLTKFIDQEIENIASLQQNFDQKAFERAVQAICSAAKIVVLGVRGSAALAWRLWFGLNKLRLNAVRIVEISAESFEYVDRLGPEDVIVAIAFPRYLDAMVRLLKNAAARQVRVISITGSEFSFIQGDINLYCPAKSTTFIANHCAPMILINALIHEASLGDRQRSLAALEDFEKLAEKNNFFTRQA